MASCSACINTFISGVCIFYKVLFVLNQWYKHSQATIFKELLKNSCKNSQFIKFRHYIQVFLMSNVTWTGWSPSLNELNVKAVYLRGLQWWLLLRNSIPGEAAPRVCPDSPSTRAARRCLSSPEDGGNREAESKYVGSRLCSQVQVYWDVWMDLWVKPTIASNSDTDWCINNWSDFYPTKNLVDLPFGTEPGQWGCHLEICYTLKPIVTI